MLPLSARPPKIFALGLVFAIAAFFIFMIIIPNYVEAQTSPTLGTAASFAVLAGSTVTDTGTSVVNGDLGVAPGSAVVGFPPGIVTPPGTQYVGDATALQAQLDVTAAFNAVAGQPCDVNLTGQDLGGLTLTRGVYCFDTSAQLTGNLTLDAEGSADAVFIFQIGSTLTTASASSVDVVNGGIDCNVWWNVASSATLGTTTSFVGSILAQESITLTTGAILSGRALAQTGAVTLDTNNIGLTTCNAQSPVYTLTPTNTPVPAATNAPSAPQPTSPPTSTTEPTAQAPSVIALPNTGGGPPQATYWMGR